MNAPAGRIAVVGLACRYPGAASPQELWENALAGRRAFRRIPPERLRLEDYRNGAVPASDGLDCTEAALLEGWEFDRLAFRVAGSTHRATDPVHWLALETAAEALRAAGFPTGRSLPRERAGVLVGNSLTGETSRAQLLRLRWPYVRRVVAAALEREGWSTERRAAFLATLEEGYKEPFEPPGEESLAGGLSNTIAGRICNHFDLGGGGYTVDGACASSLLAVANACSALAAGDLDVALAGGVDLSLDPFELVGFSRTGALSPGEMWVYDRRSQGFLPGEGCGLAVLMRLDDAVARGRPVLATIPGWGVSSDGAGGVTRPEAEGQLRALRAAYRRAGFGPETVGYFEGHGTGTAVGDATELDALNRLLREGDHPPPEPVAVGSVKAVIGHTKAAAGIAGLIKAVTAARTGVVPATVGCEQAHPRFTGDGDEPAAVRPVERAEPWRSGPRRAGVSAMGFGGINCHVVVEAAGDAVASSSPDRLLPDREELLDRTRQDAELLLLSAEDPDTLARWLAMTAERVRALSRAELTDLAAELAFGEPPGAYRCAVVASKPAQACDALARAGEALEQSIEGPVRGDGFWLGRAAERDAEPVVGLLFTGQGSARTGDGADWIRRFPEAEAIRRRAAVLEAPGSPDAAASGDGTGTIQPRVVIASLMAVALLDRLGVQARVAVGHSLGELSALCWGGVLEPDALVRLACARGKAMAELAGPPGAMASLSCSRRDAEDLVRGTPVVLAAFNGPDRVVISGPAATVRERTSAARRHGIAASLLPVSHAFHSSAMVGAGDAVSESVRRERVAPWTPGRTVVSTVTGDVLTSGVDLPELLRRQLTAPVRFAEALEAAERVVGGVDLWVEAGPGRALAELAARRGPAPATGMEAGGSSVAGLLQTAGALFCIGAPIDPGTLFGDRFVRPLPREHRFLANPCERAPVAPEGGLTRSPDGAQTGPLPAPADGPPGRAPEPWPAPRSEPGLEARPGVSAEEGPAAEPVEVVRQLVAARAELPPESLENGDRMLSDLHLNSISVGQVVVAAARRLGVDPPAAPTDFADASVAEIAAALQELDSEERAPEEAFPEGIASWVRTFTVELVERPAPGPVADAPTPAPLRVFAPEKVAGAQRLRELLGAGAPPTGTLAWLPPDLDHHALEILLAGVRSTLADGTGGAPGRFVLVHSGAGGAFARSLHLERRRGETLVVQVPADRPEAAQWVAAELGASAGTGYREAVYDARGTRHVPVLRPDAPVPGPVDEAPGLGPGDVLLVTGGGRGIGAECALALARRTGCALALVGRSQPEGSEELARNLERLTAAGVRYAYQAADVGDGPSTRAAVSALEAALAPVTAVLHAAGVNRPCPLARLDLDALTETLAPKVRGLEHVLAALDPKRLRLLVGFGSIIARTGMPGEAHYALANEALALAVERFGSRHSGCRCLTVEWSVWSGVGMGERLAGGEAMRRRGITPISTDQGVARLLELLEAPPGASPTVVVTGRFGDPPTVETGLRELPFARFLERPRVHVPGVELVVEAEVSPDTDPYLEDHVFAGERLLPAVLGLEAMAQAARALCAPGDAGGDSGSDGSAENRTVFRGVELSRPITVPADGRTTLRIAALREASGTCRVALRSSETGFRVDHFRARCSFEAPPLPADEAPVPAAELLDLDPDRELYGGLLFHRGRFRRLGGYRRLTARQCFAEIAPAPAAAGWFGRHLPPRLLLGDPGARDAALHALQASIPHATVLPLAVERLEVGVLDPDEDHHVVAREVRAEPGRLVWDLTVQAGDGRVVERWHGLTLALVGDAPAPEAWPPALLGPLLERRAAELAGTSPGTVLLQRTGAPTAPGTSERRAAGDRALAALLGEASGLFLRRGDDRPDPVADRRVSLAYGAARSGTLVLAAAGSGAVGCDLEPVVTRDPEIWRDLLGAARWELARAVARESGEDLDRAATRVWAAGEALLKAGLPSDAPLVVEPPRGAWVALRSGDLSVATCIVSVAAEDRPVAVALVCPDRAAASGDAPRREPSPQAYHGRNDSPLPVSSSEPEPGGLSRPARS